MLKSKRLIMLILPILLIAILSPPISALSFKSDKVEINRISLNANSELTAHVNIRNKFSRELDEVKVIIMIPELGLRSRSANFDLKGKSSSSRIVLLDEPNLEDNYARVVVSNDKIRRVKHRLITS